MTLRGFIALLFVGAALWAQRGTIRDFIDEEDNPMAMPPDAGEKTEFAFARLRYRSKRNGYFGRGGGSWSTDYPKADRQFMQGVRRLTRLHSRSNEEVINPGDESLFNFPWIYAVEVGRWDFTDQEASRMREYLLRYFQD